jgi:hypothetical protein
MAGNDILCGLKYAPSKGAITFKGVRYMIVRPETLMAMQKAAEKALGRNADEISYSAGFTGGYLSSKKYRAVFGLKPAEVARFMARMGGQIGWGKFTIERLNMAKRTLEATVRGSAFAEAYGRSQRPVCHVIRGIFGGLCEAVFDTKVKVAEDKCIAKGDRCCRFRVTPRKR